MLREVKTDRKKTPGLQSIQKIIRFTLTIPFILGRRYSPSQSRVYIGYERVVLVCVELCRPESKGAELCTGGLVIDCIAAYGSNGGMDGRV
jgi:hypothetical protein